MLSDDVTQLLTAYVDGELGQRQRKAVLRLLNRSPEARALLCHLQENSNRLRQLPRRKLEPSLAPVLVGIIAQRSLAARPARRPALRRHWLPYVAVGLAASVLLAATGGLFYLVTDSREKNAPTATNATPKRVPEHTVEREAPRKLPNPLIASVVKGVYSQFAAPLPIERPQGPTAIAFRDLRADGAATGLLGSELQKDSALQLEITVKNNAAALERLQATLADTGIKVVIDPAARQTLKKDSAKVEYWVYAENLKPAELGQMLQDLSKDDSRLQKFARSPFEKLTVTVLQSAEKNQVSGLLGIDAARLTPSGEPMTSPPSFKRWERSAVILPPSPPSRMSDEVRTFVRERARVRPGTLQVLVRIRQEK